MTIAEFFSLKVKDQKAILKERGVCLAMKDGPAMIYPLYQLDAFFIEICNYKNGLLSMKLLGERPVANMPYTELLYSFN
jgi:hypothetical protein